MINDGTGAKVSGEAALTGNRLTIMHTGLANSAAYTVTIPANSVRSVVYSTYNDDISWSFTTIAAPAPVPVALSLDSDGYNLTVNDTHQTVVIITYSDGNSYNVTGWATYESFKPAIATVDASGVVTGKSAGETVITATYEGKSASANVTVNLEGCFIATAAYGSYLDPHVYVLRNFRDGVLLKSSLGRLFVAWYYRNSPPLAAVIARNEPLRLAARVALTPVIYTVEYPGASGVTLLFATGVMIALRRRRRLQDR